MTPRVRTTGDGVVYAMYPRGEHPKPHLHLVAGGQKASIAIEDGVLLAGKLSSKRLTEAREWIEKHRQKLLEMWEHRMESGAVHIIEDSE
jgi:hypothetical protein